MMAVQQILMASGDGLSVPALGSTKTGRRSTNHDPYGLLALRAERQVGLRQSYSLADFARMAVSVGSYPSDKELRCFAYCVLTVFAVASRYFMAPEESFTESRNNQETNGVRQLSQHIVVELGGFSTMPVARVFKRNHASVRHAVDAVSVLRLNTPSVEAELDNLEHVILDLWALAGNGEGIKERLDLLV